MSVFVPKLAGGAVCRVYMQISGGTPVSATIDLNQTTGGLVAGTGVVEDYGTAWRVSITVTNNGTGNTLLVTMFYPSTNPAGTSSMEVGGLRVAQGAYPTSYYQTTTAPVTRNADVLVTADSVISPTIVAEFTIPTTGPEYGHVFSHSDGTANNEITLYHYRTGGTLTAVINTGGVTVGILALGAVTPGQTYKVAMRIATNDFAASKNGAAVVTDTSVALPSVTTFYRGRATLGGAIGPGLKRIRRYSIAKTNAELQAPST